MKNGILAIALAVGTVLLGVNIAAAEGDQFVFRYKGGVIQLAAATPEVPEVPDEPESYLVFRYQGGISIECKSEWTPETADTYSAGLTNATSDLTVNTLSGGRVHVVTWGTSVSFNSSLTPSDPVAWPSSFRSVGQVVPEGEFGAGVDQVDLISTENGSFNYVRFNTSTYPPIPSSAGRPCIDHRFLTHRGLSLKTAAFIRSSTFPWSSVNERER